MIVFPRDRSGGLTLAGLVTVYSAVSEEAARLAAGRTVLCPPEQSAGRFWTFSGPWQMPSPPLFPLLPRRDGGEGGQGDEGALEARPCLHEVWI